MRYSQSPLVLVALLCIATVPAVAQNQIWIRQFGTSVSEVMVAATPDGSGGMYGGGWTNTSFGGPTAGYNDAWVARYDSTGNQVWIRQLGTSNLDYLWAAATDGGGGVYVGGSTEGSLGGTNPAPPNRDAWLARYDGTGSQLWIRQFGGAGEDQINAAAPDGSGGLYAAGDSSSVPSQGVCFVARFDSAGNQAWIRRFGANWTEARAAAPDGFGGVFVAGFTDGMLGGSNAGALDAWLAHYDGGGTRTWIRQIGTPLDDRVDVAAPDGSGGAYLGGNTKGNLGGPNQGPPGSGSRDPWLARYDRLGNQTWIRQFGGPGEDYINAAAPDGTGGAYVGGWIRGSGTYLSALSRFDSAGNQVWIHGIGDYLTQVYAVSAVDSPGGSVGSLYAGGSTSTNLGGPNLGNADVWLARIDESTFASYCTAGTTTNGCVPAISGTGTPSANAASGFTIAVSSVEGQKQGLLFYGVDNGGFTPLAWGSSTSYLCVKAPTQRTLAVNSGGNFNACDGALALDWNAFRATNPLAVGQPFSAGQHVFAQGWFRDPASPKTTMLSDALEFVLQP